MSCIIEFEKCQESLFSLQLKLKQIILDRGERGKGKLKFPFNFQVHTHLCLLLSQGSLSITGYSK